jgi:hypothetical protein
MGPWKDYFPPVTKQQRPGHYRLGARTAIPASLDHTIHAHCVTAEDRMTVAMASWPCKALKASMGPGQARQLL